MMSNLVFRSIFLGTVTAVCVMIPRVLWGLWPEAAWFSPSFFFGVTVVAILLKEGLIPHWGRLGVGFGDVLSHAHYPPEAQQSLRWGVRSVVSLLLAIFGGHAGSEGAAIEGGQAIATRMRQRSMRWFEQVRRTDAAAIVAGALAAGLGAPWAATVAAFEMRIGGAVLAPVVSALAALTVSKVLGAWAGIPAQLEVTAILSRADQLALESALVNPGSWLVLGLAAVVSGVLAAGLIAFTRMARDSFTVFFRSRVWLGLLVGGALLYAVIALRPDVHRPALPMITSLLSADTPWLAALFILGVRVLSFAIMAGFFGSAGVFGPLLSLGAIFGVVAAGVAAYVGGVSALGPGVGHALILMGSASVLGGALGAPIMAAVFAFEQTRSLALFIACLLGALLAQKARKFLRVPTLLEADLKAQGIELDRGRLRGILETVQVRTCMMSDASVIYEHDSIDKIFEVLSNSPYPFLPVVDERGNYLGLLTADAVQDAVRGHKDRSNSPLPSLLEAKDLLYRNPESVPTLSVEDTLAFADGHFRHTPVLPVLAEDNRFAGLLFAYSVRAAYDREVARRLSFFRGKMASTQEKWEGSDRRRVKDPEQ